MNTCLQDCSLIISTFERSASSDFSEEGVFAPLIRYTETMNSFSGAIQNTLSSYLRRPQEEDPTRETGFLDLVRECIPCDGRLLSLEEMYPSSEFLAGLAQDLQDKLSNLLSISNLLNNIDIYSDYCSILDALSFQCIPDLQRLIALLSTLLAFEIPEIDIVFDVSTNLVAAIFTPILTSITGLLDQFSLIVLSPIDCIIESINYQLSKITPSVQVEDIGGLKLGLQILNETILEGKEKIQERLAFYIDQALALLGESNEKAGVHLSFSLKKLRTIRLIGMIAAIIQALSSGKLAQCSSSSNRTTDELETFFNTFLNPNIPYVISIDPQSGDTIFTPKEEINSEDLPGTISITEVPSTISGRAEEIQASMAPQSSISIPCKMKAQAGMSEKVARWLKQVG